MGNAQGNFYFLSLSSGHVINRTHATSLPMPKDVIGQVRRMARKQQNNPGWLSVDRNQEVLPDDDRDEADDEDNNSTYYPDGDGDSSIKSQGSSDDSDRADKHSDNPDGNGPNDHVEGKPIDID